MEQTLTGVGAEHRDGSGSEQDDSTTTEVFISRCTCIMPLNLEPVLTYITRTYSNRASRGQVNAQVVVGYQGETHTRN